ncbi:50S ribosomal protein L25/general stress protein Ctc [Magnetococcales bacterium HHB-1]
MATINAQTRDRLGKGGARTLRRAGRIPAVLYGGGHDQKNRHLSLDSNEWQKLLIDEGNNLKIKPQNLVVDQSVRGRAALVRSFQVHPVSGQTEHIDLLRFDPKMEIEVEVPVKVVGEDLCPGVKIGGVVQVVRHSLEVRCQAGNIPEVFEISVAEMEIGDVFHLNDLQLPEGVEMFYEGNFTVVTVVGVKAETAEAETEGAEGEATEEAAGETQEP